MSLQREAEVIIGHDRGAFYVIAEREYGDVRNGDEGVVVGFFPTEEAAERHMFDNHSNPGGHAIREFVGERDQWLVDRMKAPTRNPLRARRF